MQGEKVAYVNAEDTPLRADTLLEDAIKWFGDEGFLIIDEITSGEKIGMDGWPERMR